MKKINLMDMFPFMGDVAMTDGTFLYVCRYHLKEDGLLYLDFKYNNIHSGVYDPATGKALTEGLPNIDLEYDYSQDD